MNKCAERRSDEAEIGGGGDRQLVWLGGSMPMAEIQPSTLATFFAGVTVAARSPGSWGNGMKVAIIDSKADQILSGFSTTSLDGVTVGMGVTQSMQGRVSVGLGTTSSLDGYLKGIITEVGSTQISVKVLEHVSAAGTATQVDYQPG